jgi:hypothetical protein
MTMKNTVFWDVAPCRYFVNRRFGGTYRLHLQGRSNPRTMNQREQIASAIAICSSETSVNKIPTRRHIPEDGILQVFICSRNISIKRYTKKQDPCVIFNVFFPHESCDFIGNEIKTSFMLSWDRYTDYDQVLNWRSLFAIHKHQIYLSTIEILEAITERIVKKCCNIRTFISLFITLLTFGRPKEVYFNFVMNILRTTRCRRMYWLLFHENNWWTR